MGEASFRRLGRAAIVLAASAPAVAAAQSQGGGPALSLDEVRACLCLERRLEDLRREADLRESLRQERETELGRVDQQIEQSRAAMSVSDPAQVENLQRLVARQQMLRDLLQTDVRRSHRDIVTELNAAVARYNEGCTTRPMFKLDVEQARQGLQCLAP